VEALASQLERLNPTPKPLASPLLNGRWRLEYTTSDSILGTRKPALLRPSGPIYQFLGARAAWAAAAGGREGTGAAFFEGGRGAGVGDRTVGSWLAQGCLMRKLPAARTRS
jgi:hypothetical protein